MSKTKAKHATGADAAQDASDNLAKSLERAEDRLCRATMKLSESIAHLAGLCGRAASAERRFVELYMYVIEWSGALSDRARRAEREHRGFGAAMEELAVEFQAQARRIAADGLPHSVRAAAKTEVANGKRI